jgi:hypothetical protein
MTLILVTPPGVEPLTADEARQRLNLATSDVSDTVMDAFIMAARQSIDGASGWLNRCLVNQQWKLVLDRFPWQDYYSPLDRGFYPRPPLGVPYRDMRERQLQGIVLPLAPLVSVDSVKYVDSGGTQQTLDTSQYAVLPGEPSRLVSALNATWPDASPVAGSIEITFTAGYGTDGADVPEPIRTAIALQVSYLRSLSARDLFVSAETTEGVGSVNYVVGPGAGNAISGAVQMLLDPYRVILP